MHGRLIGTLAAACALAAMTLPAGAGAADGSQDYVVGDGHVSIVGTTGGATYTNVRFSAHSGPNGEDPQGFITGTYSSTSLANIFPSGTFTGRVVCMKVTGTSAVVTARLDETIITPTGPADMIDLTVTDNAEPVGGETSDSIGTGFSLESAHVLEGCGVLATSGYRPGHGNAVVNDAT